MESVLRWGTRCYREVRSCDMRETVMVLNQDDEYGS